jgi:hypothetical protein
LEWRRRSGRLTRSLLPCGEEEEERMADLAGGKNGKTIAGSGSGRVRGARDDGRSHGGSSSSVVAVVAVAAVVVVVVVVVSEFSADSSSLVIHSRLKKTNTNPRRSLVYIKMKNFSCFSVVAELL